MFDKKKNVSIINNVLVCLDIKLGNAHTLDDESKCGFFLDIIYIDQG